jgi:hypothetical protein
MTLIDGNCVLLCDMDSSTAANYEDYLTEHFSLYFEPNFETKELKAKCQLRMRRLNATATPIVRLDTSSLAILSVIQNGQTVKVAI